MWLFKADIRAIIYVIYKMKETENGEREREWESGTWQCKKK